MDKQVFRKFYYYTRRFKMYKERKAKKIYALFLAMIMVIAMAVPAFAEKAPDIKVTATVSIKGVLASAPDGSAMVEKEVTVVDLDSSGDYSFDEALVALHKAYCSAKEAGYAYSTEGWNHVTKFWNVDTGNTLFYVNGVGVTPDILGQLVKNGDNLYFSLNADDVNWADVKTTFDATSKTATVNDKISLTLNGHYGMSDEKDTPLKDVKIGYWEKGAFKEIAGAVTDANGKVTFTADKEGSFIVTAQGNATVKNPWDGTDVTGPTMAPYCVLTVNPAPKNDQPAAAKTQSVTAKKKTIKLKYKSVKKKKATIKASKVTKGNKASTKISYKLVKVNKKKSKSKFKVASSGKITVKKGTKKGTYKLTLRASAAETKEFKAASKDFQVVIIIK
jgi:hypothetical protein